MKFIFLFALFFALFFLFPFITQAQSQECQNLLKENLSFQKLIERMVELEESWLCLSQYYNQNAGTDALNYQIQTDFSKLPNIQSAFNIPARIRHISRINMQKTGL